ncbi:MAG: hypothetical protein LBS71_00325 [Puniceicoccales bacterium]|jgi:DNA polymerase-1|nr:hypothetical protein [Puniceicoccales bacterium]
MSKCFLVDGHNLAFRCFYGIPLLGAQNFPTNAILGAVKILTKIIDMEKPAHMVVFFDKGRDPKRQALLPEYKANRVEVPDPVKIQIPVIKEFAYALGCTVIERFGVEADDLMASFAQKYRSQFDEILIFSADKDLAQCIEDNIYQMIPDGNRNGIGNRLDRVGVLEKFGVYPEQIVDYLSLIGDQADNIPGIRGVGPKTASAWIKQFGSIEKILWESSAINPARFRSILKESEEVLHRNQQLIALNRNINDIYCETLQSDERQYAQLVEFYQLTSLRKSPIESKTFQPDFFNHFE